MSVCPFCGVVTDVAHESQQGCLDALTAEIARLRAILDRVKSTRVPDPPGPPDDRDDHENVS